MRIKSKTKKPKITLAEKAELTRLLRKLERLRRKCEQLKAIYHALRGEPSSLTLRAAKAIIRGWLRDWLRIRLRPKALH